MADTNTTRRVDHLEFLDNDPFAELTRIMGHDPRAAEPDAEQSEAAASGPVADDLDIELDLDLDLEKELMGELDFSDFDEPGQDHPADDQRDPGTAFDRDAVDWTAEPSAAAAPMQEAAEWSPEPAGWEDDAAGYAAQPEAEPVAGTVEEAAEWSPEPASWEDDATGYAAQPEAEPVADPVQEAAAWSPDVADRQDNAVDYAAQPEAEATAAPVQEPAMGSDIDFDFELFEALTSEVQQQPAEAEAMAAQPSAAAEVDPEAGEASVQETPAESAWPQETFVDHGQETFTDHGMQPDSAPESTDESPHWVSLEDEVPSFDAADAQHVSSEPVAAPQAPVNEEIPALSLEDELTALLLQDPAPAEPAHDVEPAAEAEASSPANPVWHSSSDIFGRANFSAGRRDVTENGAPALQDPALQEEASTTESDDFADMFGALDLDLASDPEMQPAPATPEDALPSEDDEHAASGLASPEIATIEIADAVAAVEDDLDIPDIDYGAASASGAYDDLESQFADAFGDTGFDEPAPAEQPPAPAAPIAAAAAPAQEAWDAQEPFADDGFDYEHDLERAIAETAYEEEESEASPHRRRLLIAGAVAAAAIIAGAGVLGLSFFGGDADAPALVRADADPLKVRPENPGGTTVPNQDNEVYQRVQAGETDAAPQQDSLITTLEEPLDVAAAEVLPPPVAPGMDETGEPAAAAPKAEDRIQPAADGDAALGALEDNPVITPRRVRTMVVRPDGTLVPREEAEPAAPQAAPAEATRAAPAGDAPLVAAAPEAAAGAALDTLPQALPDTVPGQTAEMPAAEEDEGPVVDTPPTVAVVPTPRAEAPAARATPAPAATPVSAPAAAAPAAGAAADGAWSMQIASQPTAEGAQATYQDLARRYGSVLQGRGVNIVRADIEGMGTYYRVRIPAATRDDAIQLCTRYKSAGGSCFVSR